MKKLNGVFILAISVLRFTVSILIRHIGISASLFKTGKNNLLIDHLDVNHLFKSKNKRSKVGFLCSVLFYGHLNRFVRLCGFILFLCLMMQSIVIGCGIP